MSDNIFERLMELLQAPGPVNWKLAAEVCHSLTGSPTSVNPALADEYRELVRVAQLHIGEVAPFAFSGNAPVTVTDRRGWADANLMSFSYLVEPLAEKLAAAPGTGPMEEMLRPLGPVVLGMQVGAMVGFMSHRILGQFDVGLVAEPDGIFLIAPNIEDFALDHHIDTRQARLWAALHEVAYTASFAVPWMTEHFSSLVRQYFADLDFDPSAVTARFEEITDLAELERLLGDPGGMAAIVSGPGQRAGGERIAAFMSLVEGHADYLIDRVAPRLIPEAARLREAVNRRRAEPTKAEQMMTRLAGLELNRLDYRLGASFSAAVTERWGEEALVRLWDDPDHLPSYAELGDPLGWAARVLVADIGQE